MGHAWTQAKYEQAPATICKGYHSRRGAKARQSLLREYASLPLAYWPVNCLQSD